MSEPLLEAVIDEVHVAPDDALAEWAPVSAEATNELLSRQDTLDDRARDSTREQALKILARCGDPTQREDRREAHLVVGEVQSGKTLSFTTVTALARDNEFPLVVVVAGTKRNLLGQTANRFASDMLASDGRPPAFRRFIAGEYNSQDLAGALRAAVDPSTPKEYRPTVVMFVLKNRSRLSRLAHDLDQSIAEIGHVPGLIIDDEADQAGMNVARSGEESTVYRALAELRRAIPRNDMLMYTATPQAPLLMSVSDQWAPRTVAVLRSGEGYVGGRRLFVDDADEYVRLITDAELPGALDPLAEDPPPSLRAAILFFLLALVATQERREPRPLSMLIHPAHTKDLHQRYEVWTRAIIDGVRESLSETGDPSFDELVEELRPLYDDMVRTTREASPGLREAATKIRYLIPMIAIKVVNSGTSEEIAPDDWGQQPGWIVIGGNKLDRGFTIENLAVTYMPRGTGVRAADTIQQRGRFFGYKAHFAGYLRGWFNAETAEAFRRYVTHERSVVIGLREVERTSMPLRTWKRTFLLDDRFRPTRSAALKLDTTSWTLLNKHGWFTQRQLFDFEMAEANRVTFRRLVEAAGELVPEPHDPRGQHQYGFLAARELLPLLSEWRAAGLDAQRLSGLELALVADPTLATLHEVMLVLMDGHRDIDDRARRRRRTLRRSGEVTLHQGRAPRGLYPGDAAYFDPDRITVQLHLLRLVNERKMPLIDTMPALAIHLPGAPAVYIER